MRNMSFSLTTEQVRAGTKDVTRRLGWAFLRPGDHLMAVEKCQGLKKGESIKRIREIEVISITTEKLIDIIYHPTRDGKKYETEREGFPELSPAEFVAFFSRSFTPNGWYQGDVRRIEFKYVWECLPSLVSPAVTA